MASFSVEVKKFCTEHKILSILTLGVAVVGFAIGKLCGRVITHIKNCFGTSKKTHELRAKIVNQPKPVSSSVILKPVTIDIDPAIKKQSEIIDQINEEIKPTVTNAPKNSPEEVKEPEKKALLKEVVDMWQEVEKQTKEIAFEFADAVMYKPNAERQKPDQVLSRFQDVKCPKETVVKVDGTYLHANHIQTKETSIQFVAAQAPLPNDHHLFWKAVFDGDYSIIDLTNTKDNIVNYCPTGGRKVGNFEFHTVISRNYNTHNSEKRWFYSIDIKNTETNEKKHVVRLHFGEWPDHGVITVQQLKNILSAFGNINKDRFEELGKKVIVHCRAGVGRTGTVIAARIIEEKIARKEITKENLDQQLVALVVELRKSRGDLFVQTIEQFNLLRDLALSLLES